MLKSEKEQLERGLQTTAVSQYGAFLDAAGCLTSISNELAAVCEHLDSLLQVCGRGRGQEGWQGQGRGGWVGRQAGRQEGACSPFPAESWRHEDAGQGMYRRSTGHCVGGRRRRRRRRATGVASETCGRCAVGGWH